MLYRVSSGEAVVPVGEATAMGEDLLESHLEDWVERSPELLGEELLVIGRQVTIDAGKDRIDLLAVDLNGSVVIVELKRDWVGGDADLQAVRYASMVAAWDHATIRSLAEDYWMSTGQTRGSFTQEMDDFCDGGYELNGTQRIVLSGRRVDPRVGTMAMWLRQFGMDVRVVTLSLFRDGDHLYLQPQIVIPLPTEESVAARPSPDQADKEWRRDGRAWHLEQRLTDHGRAVVELVLELVAAAVPEAEGPFFGQKQYIAWRAGSRNWLRCYTDSSNQAAVFVSGLGHIPVHEQAARLGWAAFDATAELAEKFALGSNVGIDGKGRLRLTIKSVDDLADDGGKAFGELIRTAWERFATGSPAD